MHTPRDRSLGPCARWPAVGFTLGSCRRPQGAMLRRRGQFGRRDTRCAGVADLTLSFSPQRHGDTEGYSILSPRLCSSAMPVPLRGRAGGGNTRTGVADLTPSFSPQRRRALFLSLSGPLRLRGEDIAARIGFAVAIGVGARFIAPNAAARGIAFAVFRGFPQPGPSAPIHTPHRLLSAQSTLPVLRDGVADLW